MAVDDSHSRGARDWRAAHQARGFVQKESADEKQGNEHPDVLRQAPHLLQHGTKLRSDWEGEKRSDQACNVRAAQGLKSSEDVTSD
jgi:hypothetical protein